MSDRQSHDLSDHRLHDWQTIHDEGDLHPDDIGRFEDEGGASPGDSRRWREALPLLPCITSTLPRGR